VLLSVPCLNPQCAPITVEGAEKGRCSGGQRRVDTPARDAQPVGSSALIQEFGGLVSTAYAALLNDPLPKRVKKMEVTEQGIKFYARIAPGPMPGRSMLPPQ
jgi:amidase